jgi:hypothetical protein
MNKAAYNVGWHNSGSQQFVRLCGCSSPANIADQSAVGEEHHSRQPKKLFLEEETKFN